VLNSPTTLAMSQNPTQSNQHLERDAVHQAMEHTHLDDNTPLYNSRVVNVYSEYLQKNYPAVDFDEVLEYAGMTRLELEDPAHWFNQNQVNRFHTILNQKTQNEMISRDVGRYAISSDALGVIKKIAISLINPASIYMFMGKIYPLISRAANVETRRIGATKIEISVVLKPGVKEGLFQCKNRVGSFEGVGKHFSNQFSKVEHPQCIHRGDSECLYIVTWEKSLTLFWQRLRNSVAIASLLLSLLLFFLLPVSAWLTVSLILGLIVFSFSTYSHILKIKDLTETITAQGDIAQDHLDGIKAQYNSSLVIEEIGKATSTLMDTQTLFETVANTMQSRLAYDRGMLFLSDPKGKYLKFAAGYGFDPQETDILRHLNFNLDNPDSKGLFTRTFHDQQPFIVHDINDLKHHFSERSQRLINQFNPHSLVCVPIAYENESLGILAVDNHISKRKLQQSDLNLLKGIAANLAISINNSIFYNKLKESEEKYRDIFENVSDFLYSHDLEGRINNANKAFADATGYSHTALTKMKLSDLLPFDYSDQYSIYLRDILASGHVEGITSILKKDGAKLILEYKSSLIVEEDKCTGVRGSARDITERWEANKEKKRLEDMLDRAKKMEAVGTLAGGVAHDLNNILSGIVSYPELLLMDLPEDSSLHEPLTTIMESGQKASAMVQDLLTMARRGVTTTKTINLNDIIHEYLNSPEYRKMTVYHPDIQFAVNTDANLLNIEGSSVHLFKTLMNLVSNAAEAMPDGGDLFISSRNQYVDKAISGFDDVHEGDYVVLAVSDTGIGISKKDQKHIFEPFYTKKIMGRSGTGLGMSVVWAAVKDHKGQIDVSSKVGVGTTISLYFPASRKKKESRADIVSIDNYKSKGESILVVDDVKEQRDLANLMLSRLGYKVATVPSGEKAVEYLKRQRADLVVLDMIMDPGIDGLETFKQILEVNSEQKAIIVSGYSDSEKVKQTQKLGAGAYVKKPYVLQEIGMAIRSELNR
jgi:PAS domain S-box-containing protein